MISVIIPAYNEEGNIAVITRSLEAVLEKEGDFQIIFIDDGSEDNTLLEIKKTAKEKSFVRYISFSRNFGHQKALKAGLDHAVGDCVISMDADMQHPPEMIPKLLERWREGYDVVYTIRRDTEHTGFIKKITSRGFYKVINRLSDIIIPFGAADFRLLSRNVVDELKRFEETWIFLRGIISWLGFKQTSLEYRARQRYAGESKYSINKMIAFAIQGVTSFSILPLRLAMIIGVAMSFGAFVYGIYALYIKLFTEFVVLGWTSVLISILFLGGIQLICLGVIGEYLGKLFIESKRRPIYIIKEKSL